MHVSQWNDCTFKCIVCVIGNHRITRIVGLIQIRVASLESVWLSMLHNRVSILKWHLFILSIPLLRVIDPCTFDGIIFNGTTLPIYINTTCYIAYHQGHSTFFLLVEMFEVDRRNGRGHLYFGVDIILVKTSCKSTVGANKQAGWSHHELNWPLSFRQWQSYLYLPKNENVRRGVLRLPQAQWATM